MVSVKIIKTNTRRPGLGPKGRTRKQASFEQAEQESASNELADVSYQALADCGYTCVGMLE